MRTYMTLLAATFVLSTTPAFAAASTNQQKLHAPDKTMTTSTQSEDAKYCVDQSPDETTGTRIYTHECRTKSEWAKRGVDIDELQKQQ